MTTNTMISEYDEMCTAARRIEALAYALTMMDDAPSVPPLSMVSQMGDMLLEEAKKIQEHSERLLDTARGE